MASPPPVFDGAKLAATAARYPDMVMEMNHLIQQANSLKEVTASLNDTSQKLGELEARLLQRVLDMRSLLNKLSEESDKSSKSKKAGDSSKKMKGRTLVLLDFPDTSKRDNAIDVAAKMEAFEASLKLHQERIQEMKELLEKNKKCKMIPQPN